MNDWNVVNQGGLYRCCIDTIMTTDFLEKPITGKTIICKHGCKTKMYWDGNAWSWLYTYEKEIKE